MNTYYPIVVQVLPLDNFHVHVYFDDGHITDYNMAENMYGPVFEPLKDINTFKEKCTVMNNTLAWDLSGKRDPSDCIDIDPVTLYEAPEISESIA